jgi:ribosomal protein L30E
MMNLDELKRLIEKEHYIVGGRMTLKLLKKGKISKIFISADCDRNFEDILKIEAENSKTPLTFTGKTKGELGVLCKKPFTVSVLSILTEKFEKAAPKSKEFKAKAKKEAKKETKKTETKKKKNVKN